MNVWRGRNTVVGVENLMIKELSLSQKSYTGCIYVYGIALSFSPMIKSN